jgi:hypothetical protein
VWRVLPALRRYRLRAVEYTVLPGRDDVQKSRSIPEFSVMASGLRATEITREQQCCEDNQPAYK